MTNTAASFSTGAAEAKSFDLSAASSPERRLLSEDQLRHCYEALKVFKGKRFGSPHDPFTSFRS
ncbi:UNVERIFIED_CONTAM: hypothetical protein Sradi_5198000 [Sesamum radiatum]|uniref:Uncharacterized protein n=1 Tax=Sesamum radiatum TaxID=300843 RepID=A0AAW2M5B1_SESRA